MAVEERQGSSALHYLGQLPSAAGTQPAAEFLQVKALHLAGKNTAAESLLDRVVEGANGDPRIPFSAGMIYVDWQLYAKAEQALSRASQLAPGNFDILYNLGLAAAKAGRLDRARESLEAALREKRDDVDYLLALSRVDVERERPEEAMQLLEQARRLAPGRADILLSMARLTEKSGAYAESAAAYEAYLR